MKKKLIILSALTVFGSPWASAQNSEIITTTLPAASSSGNQPTIFDISGSGSAGSSINIQSAVERAVEEANSVIRTYQHIQHVDLRDVDKYDHELEKLLPNSADRLPGTSRKILSAIESDPYRFAGTDVIYYENGARGPGGSSTFIAERGRNEFVISKRYPKTQTNTIFSADYISAVETAPSVIEAKILLFVHSDSVGYYFRKLTVKVDWKKNKTHRLEDVVSVVKVDQEILLSDTDFKMKGSLSAQKIILEDQNSGIIKVFPVTVGAIDARSGSVESMTFWVPERQRRSAKTEALKEEFQDFSNAALVKRDYWSTDFNTAERLYPSYYSGRPFIALIDMNFVTTEPNFSAGYREIGLHYQITEPNLERGFKSHGCVRVIDKDLYQLDAILNHGPKNKIASVFKKRLPEYEDVNHPHTYKSTYSKVAYTNYLSEIQGEYIACKYKGNGSYLSRSVRWNSADKLYHTVIDGDCLTKVNQTDNPADEVRAFWGEIPGTVVDPLTVYTEHSPISLTKEKLISYNYNSWNIDSMDHKERLKVVYEIKQGNIQINGNFSGLSGFNDSFAATPRWPSLGGSVIRDREFRRLRQRVLNRQPITKSEARDYYKRSYQDYCSNPSNGRPDQNCAYYESQYYKYY
jgi:hypothetical protein